MTELMLLRHGKSDWHQGVADFDRPLAKRGERDAKRVGACLGENGLVPDRVVSSPARRAKDTARACARAAGLDPEVIEFDERVYEANLGTLIRVVLDHLPGSSRLLLVGHNPGMEMLLQHATPEPLAWTPDGKLMTTANLAVISLDESAGDDVRGTLLQHLRPDML